jgi:hypothetical protein
VNSLNASEDNRFLATGNTSYDGSSRIGYDGAVQVWELHTGRCVNQMKDIDCGFTSHGLLQWNQTHSDSPLEQRYHFGLNTDTNSIEVKYGGFSVVIQRYLMPLQRKQRAFILL